MTSINERAFAVLLARLALILTANGYHTNAGQRVERARGSFDLAELPAISVWDDGEEPSGETGTGTHCSMTITQDIAVDIHALAGRADTGKILGLLKADAKRAAMISGDIADATGKIGTIAYRGATPDARIDGGASEAMRLRFQLRFKEAFGDPDVVL